MKGRMLYHARLTQVLVQRCAALVVAITAELLQE